MKKSGSSKTFRDTEGGRTRDMGKNLKGGAGWNSFFFVQVDGAKVTALVGTGKN